MLRFLLSLFIGVKLIEATVNLILGIAKMLIEVTIAVAKAALYISKIIFQHLNYAFTHELSYKTILIALFYGSLATCVCYYISF